MVDSREMSWEWHAVGLSRIEARGEKRGRLGDAMGTGEGLGWTTEAGEKAKRLVGGSVSMSMKQS